MSLDILFFFRVPLSVSDERSVSARLESLENRVQSAVSAMEKLSAARSHTSSLAPQPPSVSLTPAPSVTCPVPGQTFASVAVKMAHPIHLFMVGL